MKFDRISKSNDDYFVIIHGYDKRYKIEKLSDFNINYDDYIIIKASGKQRIVSVDDFLEFKHSGYFFIRKDIFNEDDFNFWMNIGFTFNYLVKPLPPKSLYEKIIIMK